MIGDDYPTGKNSERKACDSGGYYGVISQVEELRHQPSQNEADKVINRNQKRKDCRFGDFIGCRKAQAETDRAVQNDE